MSPAAKKRSITVRADLDEAVLDAVGERSYSAFVNEAILKALQARGVEQSIAEFEQEFGPIPDEARAEARKRLADSERRARAAGRAE